MNSLNIWKLVKLKKISAVISNLSKEPLTAQKQEIDFTKWSYFNLTDLFEIKKGERLTKYDRISDEENIPLITSSSENNGVVDFVSKNEFENSKIILENKITIDMFFNVFYQPFKYFSDDNVHSLIPKFEDNSYINLFLVTLFKSYQQKYSYGRQVRINRLEKEKIFLPTLNNQPDFKFMENYIKSVNYSTIILSWLIRIKQLFKSLFFIYPTPIKKTA